MPEMDDGMASQLAAIAQEACGGALGVEPATQVARAVVAGYFTITEGNAGGPPVRTVMQQPDGTLATRINDNGILKWRIQPLNGDLWFDTQATPTGEGWTVLVEGAG